MSSIKWKNVCGSHNVNEMVKYYCDKGRFSRNFFSILGEEDVMFMCYSCSFETILQFLEQLSLIQGNIIDPKIILQVIHHKLHHQSYPNKELDNLIEEGTSLQKWFYVADHKNSLYKLSKFIPNCYTELYEKTKNDRKNLVCKLINFTNIAKDPTKIIAEYLTLGDIFYQM